MRNGTSDSLQPRQPPRWLQSVMLAVPLRGDWAKRRAPCEHSQDIPQAVTLVLKLSLQKSEERDRRIGKVLVFVANIEVRKPGVYSC